MNQELRVKATAILDTAVTRQLRPPPICLACGRLQALPASSAYLVTASAR
ncbi:hypothetical protein [Hyalangium rubrum]|uniref:Uncharacterized protein n=1 Tax=Hyalangium rubrum TaxID=3103134 RepID=A0ABU5HER5_9BACT|nr:hypothetical protein [Hyalangium sp. s54d21]MDY7230575.1 hypothetical protein [Hyalangium sp. s54d21]